MSEGRVGGGGASLPTWAWAVLAVAAVQILLGWSGFLAILLTPSEAPATGALLFLLMGAAFVVASVALLVGARGDGGAASLGAVYLLVACGFAERGIDSLAGLLPPGVALAVSGFGYLQVEALGAYFLWRFACQFPFDSRSPQSPSRAGGRMGTVLRRVALGVGVLLIVTNAALYLQRGADAPWLLTLLDRRQPSSHYWTALFPLVLAALGFLVWRSLRMPAAERGRVVLFAVALVVGFLPLTAAVLLEALFPAVGRWLEAPRADRWARAVVYPPLLAVPIFTAYSVIVDRVLEVRLVTRQALGYAFARYAVLLAPALPIAALLTALYLERDLTMRRLLSGPTTPLVVASALAAALAFALRRRLLTAIDRRFLRAPYDSQWVLSSLVERVRETSSGERLEALVLGELERALHPRSAALLLRDARRGCLARPGHRQPALDAASVLARALADRDEPIDASGEEADWLRTVLPSSEAEWLSQSGLCMLVPILSGDGSLLGVIGLGERRSELPYGTGDRRLLKAVAAAVALSLENRLLAASPLPREARSPSPADSDTETLGDPTPLAAGARQSSRGDEGMELAYECRACGQVQPGAGECDQCGGHLERALLPYVLLDKFRLEERIGAGAMGVVYRASDLVLGREVAIKALPRVTPRQALRLRREARAVAAIEHPNLALIYGAELWHGMPVLVFELLRGGTLADRLDKGALAVDITLRMGRDLCSTLQAIHDAGILHRDIKPSNIGFTTSGVPKLLDFGLARLVSDPRAAGESSPAASRQAPSVALSNIGGWASLAETQPASPVAPLHDEEGVDLLAAFSVSGQLVGTPLYLSPEAIRQEPPSPLVDLWSLSMVLYEAIAGLNPVRRESVAATLQALLAVEVPDLRVARPDVDPRVAAYFATTLARDPGLRPHSASELGEQLERLLAMTR